MNQSNNFCVRTITFFLPLTKYDFTTMKTLDQRIALAATFLDEARRAMESEGFRVQTCRIATSPFPEWIDEALDNLTMLESALELHNISFCSMGPADTPHQVKTICGEMIRRSSRFSCSAYLRATDVVMARTCAELVLSLADVRHGLGNFHFCVASAVPPEIPFFPAAKAGVRPSFAIGLENGSLAHNLLLQCGSIENISTIFRDGLQAALYPLHDLCKVISSQQGIPFVGIDTSLNPSLSGNGSVAAAIETLDEVSVFGNVGTVAAAASITQAIQSLPGITNCGYSGLMLPVCEDRRLAELPDLNISNLLSISQVCGVGVDTVPVPGNVSVATLQSLFLDVAAMAGKWNKPLSCRVFPVAGAVAGEMTTFESPYLVNAPIFRL
jgi:uncharacterized protein